MTLESEFHQEMLNIYRRAQSEANYNATRFLQMVAEIGGVETAHRLINSENVSEGYTALWERGKLELTVEALILENHKFQSLFTEEQISTCAKRLKGYGYKKNA
ncbi:MAG: hypothetical protein L3J63_01110 [Geopsychrobacter sp.]|nr:hypothetical protein [Geopsychrobacter sp.]